MEVYAAGRMRPVHIEYKPNKNIWMRMNPDGSLRITCSRRVAHSEIKAFIESRERWILRTEKKLGEKKTMDSFEGDTLMWMGKQYRTSYEKAQDQFLTIDGDVITFHMAEDSPENRREVFYDAAKRQLQLMIEERRNDLDREICLKNSKPLPRIRLRYMTSRWGSCTPSKAHISISLRLIHRPAVCLDYVLLHEYAHMLVPNHSRQFHDVLKKYMPDYRQAEALLR